MKTILAIIGFTLIMAICFFVLWILVKAIHFIIVKKEVEKIFNNSRNDDQFLCVLYNTFELKEKTK
jgi:hypothetical protein